MKNKIDNTFQDTRTKTNILFKIKPWRFENVNYL